MASSMDDPQAQARDVVQQLQSPISDLSSLLALLSGPLDCLGLLPPQFRRYNANPLPSGSISLPKHVPLLQRALLEHIAPVWDTSMAEANATLLLEQYFCPDSFSFASSVSGDVTLLAYSTILSLPLTSFSAHLLARLSAEYPVDRLHSAVFSHHDDSTKESLAWEDYVRNIAAVPAKVANAFGATGEIPPALEHATYFNSVSRRCESLVASLADQSVDGEKVPSVTCILTRLVNLGVFPPTPPTSRSQPSFFQVALPQIRARLDHAESPAYSQFWSDVFVGFSSISTLQAILTSLFGSLRQIIPSLDPSPSQRALVKHEAILLRGLVGYLASDKQELWEVLSAVILGRDWDEGHSRILVCWVAGSEHDGHREEALNKLLDIVLSRWSAVDHIKHSLLSRHRYITSLLLLIVSYLPAGSRQLDSLATSPVFIGGVGTYIGHLDASVRRCGMLAAEVVAKLANKTLDFGDWEGDAEGKQWARDIRKLIAKRDLDADLTVLEQGSTKDQEILIEELISPNVSSGSTAVPGTKIPISMKTDDGYDSDDSLTGYASPPSSRSSSPTPSELAEIEKDPTLGVGVKKIARPVYFSQLGGMVRSAGGLATEDANNDADKIEIALQCAEELIRKKRGYGTELEENAVNLVYGFVGLQNKYELDHFEAQRQRALQALVACCPRKAAPSIIEEFFKNQYSTDQRFVMLNALGMGARELAGLPLPPSAVVEDRIPFPSKLLPPALHQKYIGDVDQTSQLTQIMDGISRDVLNRENVEAADTVPELVRERRLRVQKPKTITEVHQLAAVHPRNSSSTPSTFNHVAAEFFIAPLVNRFWLFLRDEQTREERTAHLEGRPQYRGAGTGLILSPIVLAQYLRTLAILVHAAQNASEWLSVIGPDALELAVTVGTKPVSQIEVDEDGTDNLEEKTAKEASVLTSSLELALVVLDTSLETDGGRSLSLDRTALLMGAGEWAGSVFARLDKGLRMQGGGGREEVALKRAAAGVLLKVDAITSKWKRSMIDTFS